MRAADPGAGGPSGIPVAGRVRIQATPGRRRAATCLQWVLVALILGLLGAGARLVVLFRGETGDPEVGRLLWLFAGVLALSALTLAWLVVLIQDLAKVVIDLDDHGVTVTRLLQGFTACWDEIQEIGVAPALGHLTLRTPRGSLTTTARLLGPGPFVDLVGALRERARAAIREWTPWAAARRQLLLLTVPLLGAAVLALLARGLHLRRPPAWGRRP